MVTAYERRSYAGNAIDGHLSVGLNATDTTITLDVADIVSGWPDGTAGPFYVTIDPGGAEEKAQILSRSGNVLTLSSAADRGLDGTVAVSHSAGVIVSHTYSARDADEANYAASQTVGKVTTKGDILVATGLRAFARLPAGVNGNSLISDSTQATGWRLAAVVEPAATQTLTNKTLTTPTIAAGGWVNANHTHADANTGGSVTGMVTLTGTATLTNKTLTSPVVNSPTGIVKADVGLANVDNTSDATKNTAAATLTNKTLTAPTIGDFTNANHTHADVANGGGLTGTAWQTPTLQNSWVNFNVAGGTYRQARYMRSATNRVYCEGLIKDGTNGSGVVLFNLPAGYRPTKDNIFLCFAASGSGSIIVSANGDVKLNGAASSNASLSLAEISFQAD